MKQELYQDILDECNKTNKELKDRIDECHELTKDETEENICNCFDNVQSLLDNFKKTKYVIDVFNGTATVKENKTCTQYLNSAEAKMKAQYRGKDIPSCIESLKGTDKFLILIRC